ncbi:MAG TPA: site-specific DNA-methyltransferase, partial [Nitrososphaerales archaeon]|nr:site-specific DNA-methyltransferase [Nitrososphaerales archaeon]
GIGNTILDPMMGSGTAGVSALGLNRDFIGIEKEKRTFDIAQARISETVIQ